MNVRPVRPEERAAYQRMRLALWPDCSDADIDPWLGRPDTATFVAERTDGALIGFVEVGARNHAEGCDTSPVGFIEGWWVEPDARRSGTGRALLRAAEDWARGMGYREIASDALLENVVSHQAHVRCGYEEVERLVAFRKAL